MKKKNVVLVSLGSALAIAASLFFIKKRKGLNEDKPPKGAPQLDIENPGTQDDFPKPPMESEVG